MTKKLSLILFFSILSLSAAQPILANPISYVIKGNAAGTLGGSSFGFTDVTVVLVADTGTIMDVADGKTNLASSATFSLSTPAQTVGITDPVTIFVDQTNGQLSLTTPAISDPLIVLSNAAFASYGLDTDLGPASGGVPMFFGFENLPTSGGAATITAMAEDPTFTADLDPGIDGSVPEPAALWLFASGLAGLGLIARRPV